MATTLVIVEFLIVGFQVCVWIGLLVWKYCDMDDILMCLKEWSPLSATCALALAYTLGVTFDRFAGAISAWVQKKTKRARRSLSRKGQEAVDRTPSVRETPDDVALRATRLMLKYPEAYAYWEQLNRQIRLLRATCVNGLICAIVVLFFYRSVWCIPLVPLTFISAYAWHRENDRGERVQRALGEALAQETQHSRE